MNKFILKDTTTYFYLILIICISQCNTCRLNKKIKKIDNDYKELITQLDSTNNVLYKNMIVLQSIENNIKQNNELNKIYDKLDKQHSDIKKIKNQ
jgi:predicted  nucleic acid-binding Zn-ribbon protein